MYTYVLDLCRLVLGWVCISSLSVSLSLSLLSLSFLSLSRSLFLLSLSLSPARSLPPSLPSSIPPSGSRRGRGDKGFTCVAMHVHL